MPTRWRGRRGSAYADGSRAHAPDGGCSAGTSACPWPRLYLLNYVTPALATDMNESCRWARSSLVSARILLASRRGTDEVRGRTSPVAAVSPLVGDCSRVLIWIRRVKPRRPTSGTVTASRGKRSGNALVLVTVVTLATWQADTPKNLEPMLPNGWRTNRKLVSFCQCRCTTAQDNKPERSRRYEPTDVPVTSLSARASCMQNTSTTAFFYFVHSLWITMWTDCRRFIEPPVRRLRGGSSR